MNDYHNAEPEKRTELIYNAEGLTRLRNIFDEMIPIDNWILDSIKWEINRETKEVNGLATFRKIYQIDE